MKNFLPSIKKIPENMPLSQLFLKTADKNDFSILLWLKSLDEQTLKNLNKNLNKILENSYNDAKDDDIDIFILLHLILALEKKENFYKLIENEKIFKKYFGYFFTITNCESMRRKGIVNFISKSLNNKMNINNKLIDIIPNKKQNFLT